MFSKCTASTGRMPSSSSDATAAASPSAHRTPLRRSRPTTARKTVLASARTPSHIAEEGEGAEGSDGENAAARTLDFDQTAFEVDLACSASQATSSPITKGGADSSDPLNDSLASTLPSSSPRPSIVAKTPRASLRGRRRSGQKSLQSASGSTVASAVASRTPHSGVMSPTQASLNKRTSKRPSLALPRGQVRRTLLPGSAAAPPQQVHVGKEALARITLALSAVGVAATKLLRERDALGSVLASKRVGLAKLDGQLKLLRESIAHRGEVVALTATEKKKKVAAKKTSSASETAESNTPSEAEANATAALVQAQAAFTLERQTMQQDIERMTDSLSKYESAIEANKRREAHMQSQRTALQARLVSSESRRRVLAQQVDDITAEKESLVREQTEKNDLIQTLESKILSLQSAGSSTSSSSDSSAELASLHADKTALAEQVVELEGHITALENEARLASEQGEAKIQQMESRCAALGGALAAKEVEMEQIKAAAAQSSQASESQAQSSAARLALLQSEVELLRSAVAEVQGDLLDAHKQVGADQVDHARAVTELAGEHRAAVEVLEGKIAALQAAHEQQAQAAREQVAQLESQLCTLRSLSTASIDARIAELDSKLSFANAQVHALRMENAGLLRAAQEASAQSASEIALLKSRNTLLESFVAQVESKVPSLQEEIRLHDEQAVLLRDQVESARHAAVLAGEQVDGMKAVVKALEEQLAAKDSAIAAMESAARLEAKEERDQIASKLAQALQDHSLALAELAKSRQGNLAVEQELFALRREFDQLRSRHAELDSEHQSLRSSHDELQQGAFQSVDTMHALRSAHRQEKSELEKELDARQASLVAATSKAERLTTDVAYLETSLTAERLLLSARKFNLTFAERQAEAAASERDALKARVAELQAAAVEQSEAAALREKNAALTEQLTKLQEQLSQTPARLPSIPAVTDENSISIPLFLASPAGRKSLDTNPLTPMRQASRHSFGTPLYSPRRERAPLSACRIVQC